MLHEFLTLHRDDIIARTRVKVAIRIAPRATEPELEHGVSLFLDQLSATLRREKDTSARQTSEEIAKSAALHGGELRRAGFTVAQVVHDYGDLCQAVTELAIELESPIATDEFHDPQSLPRRRHRRGRHRVRPPARDGARRPRDRAPGLLRPPAPQPAGQRDAGLRHPEIGNGRGRRQHGRDSRTQPDGAARPRRPLDRRSAPRSRAPSPRARAAHPAHGRDRAGGARSKPGRAASSSRSRRWSGDV